MWKQTPNDVQTLSGTNEQKQQHTKQKRSKKKICNNSKSKVEAKTKEQTKNIETIDRNYTLKITNSIKYKLFVTKMSMK